MPLRQWFPNQPLVLLRAPCRRTMTAEFKVARNMAKPDIKEYLQKIYRIPVVRVATANMTGKTRRIVDYRGKQHSIKRPDYKKAWVQIETVPEEHFALFEQWNEERDKIVAASARDLGIRRIDGH
uniref:Large ribosomal subunit protein uL23m n=1 Tax=Pinguiococcus pyrenoidosus TaxID=172671 RepID=A0A7R9Y967_9STRA|mmetsp:Transcript_11779/g.43892  ORF Transcript_11779/g.43892 Transcript_11779/m.43892 type:complete len:125 (+) Transcript_11779:65-439(+)